MQIGSCGDTLIRGDVALHATAWVGSVVGCPERHGVVQHGAPRRVGERFLRLQAEAVARHHPADTVDDPGREQCGCRDHWQQRLAAAGCHRRQNVGDLVGLAGSDRANDGGDLGLVGAEGRGGDDKQRGSSGVAGRVSVFFEAL